MEIKTECFAWNPKRKECDILTSVVCKNKECKFYKTEEKLKNEQQEAQKKNYGSKNVMARIFKYKDDIWRFKEV